MSKAREYLEMPNNLKAPNTGRGLMSCLRLPYGRTRIGDSKDNPKDNYDSYKEPMKWKKELELEHGIQSEIITSRKGGHNPVLVYKIN